jgi:hypothetical protein
VSPLSWRSWRCSSGQVGAGIDIKGDGGYVILPPSDHASGRQYCWLIGQEPGEREIADAPDWLLEMIERATGMSAFGPDASSVVGDEVPEGYRNKTLSLLIHLAEGQEGTVQDDPLARRGGGHYAARQAAYPLAKRQGAGPHGRGAGRRPRAVRLRLLVHAVPRRVRPFAAGVHGLPGPPTAERSCRMRRCSASTGGTCCARSTWTSPPRGSPSATPKAGR